MYTQQTEMMWLMTERRNRYHEHLTRIQRLQIQRRQQRMRLLRTHQRKIHQRMIHRPTTHRRMTRRMTIRQTTVIRRTIHGRMTAEQAMTRIRGAVTRTIPANDNLHSKPKHRRCRYTSGAFLMQRWICTRIGEYMRHPANMIIKKSGIKS